MRPFWRYYGGKWRAAARYPEPLPGLPIIEPFAGAAGYATRYGADREVLLVEKDARIAAIWRWLIRASPDDILGIPDIPDGGTVDDINAPRPARDLAGFWCNDGVAQPCKTPSVWASRKGRWFGWGDKARSRIAAHVPRIRSWVVLHGDYTAAPDCRGTWFVDPPYSTPAGRHYKHHRVNYGHLGRWCRERKGRVIVCEQEGADWLPFKPLGDIKSTRGSSKEVVWLGG